jgi:AcrR family transcriptional regulator
VFADGGYRAATVREICTRAGANVASVNYHFRDKMGLYVAVLRQSMCVAGVDDRADPALLERAPEKALRLFVAGMLNRMNAGGQHGVWHLRIMAHEMAQPTEALPRVVEEVIAPRYAALRQIISRIIGLPPDHDTTRLCAHSVIGQVIHYAHARPAIAHLWPALKMGPERLEQIATHIADFSLCSLRAIARRNKRNSR